MQTFFRYSVALCFGVLSAATACNGSKKENQPTATAPEDTMLLRDLAEANRNTANAAALDNSLTAVRTSPDSQAPAPAGTTQPLPTAPAQVAPRGTTAPSSSAVRPSSATQTTAQTTPTTRARLETRSEEADRTTTRTAARTTARTTTRTTESRVASSSSDPCDSPTATDQRTCLNNSIVENDAELNRTYQDLIAQSRKSGGPELEERLREAQRAWVNDRDMACRRSGDDANGLWARPVARCLAEYSAKRTAELRRTLNGFRGR